MHQNSNIRDYIKLSTCKVYAIDIKQYMLSIDLILPYTKYKVYDVKLTVYV